MIRFAVGENFLLVLSILAVADGRNLIELPSEARQFFGGIEDSNGAANEDAGGTKWAVLLAGSTGYWNYRIQADLCHAYQILEGGGLKDENIIVFMYDDIAQNEENPRPGGIINSLHGEDVYKGVPKIWMPTNPYLYANDIVDVLKKKHASGTYKSLVRRRTANQNYLYGSYVMQYGDLKLSVENLFLYMDTKPANDNQSFVDNNALHLSSKAIDQCDADLLHFWHKFIKAPEGSLRKFEAQKQLADAMAHRTHIDSSIKLVGKLLFGIEKGPEVLKTIRPTGQPLVDDWTVLNPWLEHLRLTVDLYPNME